MHDRAENDRRDEHLHRIHKGDAERFQRHRLYWPHEAHQDAEDDADEHLHVEIFEPLHSRRCWQVHGKSQEASAV